MAKIGELLVERGLLTRDGLEEALDWQVLYGGRLGTNLLELKLVEEADLAQALGKQLGAEVAWGELQPDPSLINILPRHIADRGELIPWKLERRRLKILCTEIKLAEMDKLGYKLGRPCVPVVAPEFRIHQLLRAHYQAQRQMRALDFGVVPEEGREERRRSKQRQEKGPAEEPAPELIDESAFNDIYNQVLAGRSASAGPVQSQSWAPSDTTWPGGAALPQQWNPPPAAPSPRAAEPTAVPAARAPAPAAPPRAGPASPAASAPPRPPSSPATAASVPPAPATPATTAAVPVAAARPKPAASPLPAGPAARAGSSAPAPAATAPPMPATPGARAAPSVPARASTAPPPGAAQPALRSAAASPGAVSPPGAPAAQPGARPAPPVPAVPAAAPRAPLPSAPRSPAPAPPPRAGQVAPPAALAGEPAAPFAATQIRSRTAVRVTQLPDGAPLRAPATAPPPALESLPDDAILEELPEGAILGEGEGDEGEIDAGPPLAEVSWDEIPAPPEPVIDESPLEFRQALKLLEGVTDRDSIAHIVLRASRSKAARALLLQVQGGVALGWDGLGEGFEPRNVRAVAIPLGAQSAFQLVVKTRSHYMGPLQKTPLNIRFLATLGKKVPLSSLILPILHKGRVSYLLYLDNGHRQQAPTDVGEMLILSQRIAQSVEALVERKRKAARG